MKSLSSVLVFFFCVSTVVCQMTCSNAERSACEDNLIGCPGYYYYYYDSDEFCSCLADYIGCLLSADCITESDLLDDNWVDSCMYYYGCTESQCRGTTSIASSVMGVIFIVLGGAFCLFICICIVICVVAKSSGSKKSQSPAQTPPVQVSQPPITVAQPVQPSQPVQPCQPVQTAQPIQPSQPVTGDAFSPPSYANAMTSPSAPMGTVTNVSSPPPPPGWELRTDPNSGQPFYFNQSTGAFSFTYPV